MIDFATLQGLTIPEGIVSQITDASGRILWSSGEPAVLEVEKIISNTYVSSTTYQSEEFILIDIYPKTNRTVKVTYGGVTKTITDTSGLEKPIARQVFFGTFGGVSDDVATPTSGTLTIEGGFYSFESSSFNKSKDTTSIAFCIKRIANSGSAVTIHPNAFEKNTSMSGFVSGKYLKDIGSYAFDQCSNLNTLHLGKNVEQVSDCAFRSCNNLSNISVDPNNALYSTDGVTLFDKNKTNIITAPGASGDFIVPNSVTNIENYAFQGAPITSIDFPEGLISIGEYAFRRTLIQDVNIPKSVKSMGKYAFSNCESLSSVTIPEGVPLGSHMFYECRALTSIVIPIGTTEIPDSFCDNCQLVNITLPEGLISIGKYAFHNSVKSSSITSITIPSTVTSIESGAFYALSDSISRTYYMLPTTPPTLGSDTSLGIGGGYTIGEIVVPKGCAEAYKSAKYWNNYADKIVEGS